MNRYVEHTALSNPHCTLHYLRPRQEPSLASRARPRSCRKEAPEIKPHPHGVELGALMLMAAESKSHDVKGVPPVRLLARLARRVADEICRARAG